jgi:hypothetical protein
MGSLEDAIREHLELKRLRGADPAEVAREQHEALDPPTGEDPAAAADALESDGTLPTGQAPAEPAVESDHPAPAPSSSPSGEPSAEGQETAELDMRAVLQGGAAPAGDTVAPVGPIVAGPARASSAAAPEEDSLEWEMPERSSDANTAESAQISHAPEQERLAFE